MNTRVRIGENVEGEPPMTEAGVAGECRSRDGRCWSTSDKRHQSRKLCLLSIACHDLFCPMFGAEADAYEAFCRAAAADDPELAVSKAVEKFPWYWEFDGTAWGFAELMTGPKTDGLWPTVRTLIQRSSSAIPFVPCHSLPEWAALEATAVLLARQMYAESDDFRAMPILADALQDAGCDSTDVLNHSRSANCSHRRGAMIVDHVRGCWVVDAVLNKG